MQVIIFDLDLTLAETEACRPYLTSGIGRETIASALQSGIVNVSAYDKRLVESVNKAANSENHRVIVVSDSPKSYCLEVLSLCGYNVDPRLVFGAQGKPLVDFDSISSVLVEVLGYPLNELNFVVVGDSPKDMYFAHSIQAPSIFAGWGTKHEWQMVKWSRPTVPVYDFDQLKVAVDLFLNGKLNFENYDFKKDYITCNVDDMVAVELQDKEIGYGREYVPNSDHYRSVDDKYASRDLRWVVKKSKDYDEAHHNRNAPMSMYGRQGIFATGPLKRKAGFFKREFLAWCNGNGIEGKVVLVPVPPSVPRECNLTHTVSLICDWWAQWITEESDSLEVKVVDAFERYLPKIPSHLSSGRRIAADHFETLGMFPGRGEKLEGVNYVILVDDVVTSGAHMNALASFIRTEGWVDDDVSIYGYAIFKTVHPENEVDFDFSIF